MRHPFKSEKRQRFSLRKLSIGLVSATIGSFVLLFTDVQQVLANEASGQDVQLDYRYVAESELTAQEKSLLVGQLPGIADASEEAYYLVYRPSTALPRTGEQQLLEGAGVILGTSLLVLVLAFGRNRKTHVKGLFLLTAAGTSLVAGSALALTNDLLAQYNQTLQLKAGQQLPAPLELRGYTYLGYIPSSALNQGETKTETPAHPQPAALQGQMNKQESVQEATAEKPVSRDDRVSSPVLPSHPDTSSLKEESGKEAETTSPSNVTPSPEVPAPVLPPQDETSSSKEEPGKEAETTPPSNVTPSPEVPAPVLPPQDETSSSKEEPGKEDETTPPSNVTPSPEVPAPVLPPQDETSSSKEEPGKEDETTPPSNVTPSPEVPAPVLPPQDDTPETPQLDRSEALKAIEEARLSQIQKINANQGLSDGEARDALAAVEEEASKAIQAINAGKDQEAVLVAKETGLAELTAINPVGKEFATAEIDDLLNAHRETVNKLKNLAPEEKTALLFEMERAADQVKGAIDQLEDYGDTVAHAAAVEEKILKLVKDFEEGLKLAIPEEQTPPKKEDPAVSAPVLPPQEEKPVLEKPVVTVESITPKPDQHAVEIIYQIQDKSQTLLSAKTQVFKGEELVKEVELPSTQTQVVIPELDYYTEYTLKTIVLYNLGQGEKKDELGNPTSLRLDYKKLEFKDVTGLDLYKKSASGYQHQLYLDQVPADLDHYFVKLRSAGQKESLLPISSITPEMKDGKPVYKVAVALPELVQDLGGTYQDHFHFYIEKTPEAKEGVYTSFAALVTAMKADLAGTFRLGADLSADEVNLPEGATSYVPGDFTGKLIGRSGQQAYGIHDLKQPLFEHLLHATVENLDLKSVDITSDEDTASLAKEASQSRIEDVSAQGKIKGHQNIGGLVATAGDSQFINSSFTGKLTSSQLDNKYFLIGGLVAGLSGQEASIERSTSKVHIISTTANSEQVIGGLVGQAQKGVSVKDSYAAGSIQHVSDYDYVGSLIGATQGQVTVNQAIADMDVPEGTPLVGLASQETILTNLATSSASEKESEKNVPVLEANDLAERVRKLGITTRLDDSGQLAPGNLYQVDYSQVAGAQPEYQLAYENMEKLLPFYNKELLVEYGNKLAPTDLLYKKALIDVVPMQDHQVITDIAGHKQEINRLLLHFEDGTASYLDISYKGDFGQTGVAEYSIAGTDLLYTPETRLGDYSNILKAVLPGLEALDFHSQEVADALGMTKEDNLQDLYLEKAFKDTQAALKRELPKVLAMDKAVNSAGKSVADYIQDKIKSKQAAFLLGLSYLNRWYNVNYGDVNAKDLLTYKLDFFGNKDTSVLDAIIALGESGFENLKPANNVKTFGMSLAQETGQADLFAYLESYRQLLLPDKTNNQWLKENTKAYIQERKSNIPEVRALQDQADAYDKHTVGVYDRITSTDWEDRNMLLPLLTLPEKGVYIISNLSTLAFGSYERYKDPDKENGNQPYSGQALNDYVERLVDQSADKQRDHYDFWYRMLKPEDRDNLFRKVLVYDGFKLKDDKGEERWVDLHDKASSIQNFFGPVGKWYPEDDSGAYANGYETHFVGDPMLGTYGTSVYTHEMVHNSDERVYFKGYGRRSGLGAEFYALGLLQSSTSLQDQTITLNTIITGDEKDKDDRTRMQVLNPAERFKTREDLQEYVHGMHDAIYLLDYLEGQSIVKRDDAFKKAWLRKIENYVRPDKYDQPSYAGNSVRSFTDEEIAKIKTFTDLIDQDAMVRRNHPYEGEQEWNGYYTINLLDPIYAGLSHPDGTPGDIMFRKTAYELLADKGYYDGFLPYVSGQYGVEALAQGKKTYSEDNEEEVGLVTDKMVLDKVYKGKYASFADFKKAMYQERIDKLGKLKPFTITYKLGDPQSTEKVTITSYQKLQELMDAAVELDKQYVDTTTEYVAASWVHHLKAQVYNALLRSSQDFKESIFED